VIAEAWVRCGTLGLYLSLVVVTGVRRGELCGLQICDVDVGRGPCGPAPMSMQRPWAEHLA
jgi:integrase